MPSSKTTLAKAEMLGMDPGTASSILKKRLMFSMAQRLNEDVCFHCGEKIETVDDFTVEHKKPWLHESAELFWDLGNLAFSHAKCNVGAARKPNKKVGPEGTSWCSDCSDFVNIDLFHDSVRERLRSGESRSGAKGLNGRPMAIYCLNHYLSRSRIWKSDSRARIRLRAKV